jgi:transposase-like protein
MPRPRKYPDELIERGVRLALASDQPIAQIARNVGMHPEALRKRVRQAEADSGKRTELLTSEEREESPGAAHGELRASRCHWGSRSGGITTSAQSCELW